jgi:hypothetical protein
MVLPRSSSFIEKGGDYTEGTEEEAQRIQRRKILER